MSQVPANLLFFLGSLVLLVLTLQHSYELGRLEEKTRTLAEELAPAAPRGGAPDRHPPDRSA